MPNGGQPNTIKPPLTRRTKFGIGVTVVTLLILVYPGGMVLPLWALLPVMPRMHGCANFLGPMVFLAFFGLAFLLSAVLIGLGIVTLILAALRRRIGLVGAVLVNAAVVSLLLLVPLGYPANDIPEAFGLYVLLAVCAVIPATALVLFLSPTVFNSWWQSRRPFVATAVAAGLLLMPGALGAVALGLDVRDAAAGHLAATQPTSSVSSGSGC